MHATVKRGAVGGRTSARAWKEEEKKGRGGVTKKKMSRQKDCFDSITWGLICGSLLSALVEKLGDEESMALWPM